MIINTVKEKNMGHRNGGPKKGTMFPHRWVSGPDPLKHKQYLTWLQQRNQAQFRGESWDLSFETWLDMWGELWEQRGRGRDQYCMTREDPDGAWDKDNTIVILRKEHLLRHRARQIALGQTKGYKKRMLLNE
jgi:hypothetical protein